MNTASPWMRWLRPLARAGVSARPAVVAEPMEPRILYSADLAAGLALGSGLAGIAEHRTLTVDGEYGSGAADLVSGSWGAAAHPVVQSSVELAFVDMSVWQAQDLVSDLQAQREAGRSIEVVSIGAGEDGIARIAAALEGRSDIAAIHVLSHGEDGAVLIGSSRLDAAALAARGAEIAGWGLALTGDADLVLYGCDVAAGPAGERLLAGLAALTGADVAASADLTGAAGLGGNWSLEASVGPVEAATALDAAAQAAWQGVLGAAPTVSAIADQSIPEDTSTPPIAFTVADADTPVNQLDVSVRVSDAAILAPGGIALGGGGANRTVTLTPVAGASGSVTVTVDVTDRSQVTSTSFQLSVTPVNDAPNGAGQTRVIVEDTAYTFTAADFGFSDPGDAPANALQAVRITSLPLAGTLTSRGAALGVDAVVSTADLAAGALVYTPGPNGNGVGYAAFTFQVRDDGGTANGGVDLDPVARSFTFDVTPVNDGAPVNDVAPVQATSEDKAFQMKTVRGTAITVSDVDGGILTTTVSTSNGTLFAPANPTTAISGNRTAAVTITGLAADINVVLDGMRLTSVSDYNGPATLTVTTTDGSLSTTDVVALTITPVADVVADAAATRMNTPVTIDVLGNDTFKNPAATITAVNGAAITDGAAAVVVPNGSVALLAGKLVFTPEAGFVGVAPSFTYTVTSGGVDETANVSVTVSPLAPPVNTLPGAQGIAEDTSCVFSTASGNAISVADADSAALTTTVSASNGTVTAQAFAGATITGNGGAMVTISGTAAAINGALDGLGFHSGADFNGHAILTVATSDGVLANSGTIGIDVNAVADIVADSVSTSEDATLTFNALSGTNGASADSFEDAARALSEVTQASHGSVTFSGAGEITYTPNADYSGADSFTYTVAAGGVTETATVDVAVTAVNDAPVANADSLGATEDTPVTFDAADLLGNDADVDTPHAALAIASVTSGAGGTAVLNPGGTVIFTPGANFTGSADFRYTVTDGALTSAAATASLTVAGVNDAPVANADSLAATEDTTVTFAAADLLGNDTDIDTPPAALTIASVASGAGGTAVLNPDGTVTFTPGVNFNGAAAFTYTVSDGTLTSAPAAASVTVGAVNDAPVANADSLAATEDTPVTFAAGDLLANDTDVDTPHAALTLTSITSGAGGSAVLNPDGTLTFTPGAHFTGLAGFTYTVSDGALTSAGTATVSVAPGAVSPPPVAVGDHLAATEDTPVTYAAADLLANDSDADTPHAALRIASVASGSGGTVVLNADGTVTFTPNADFNGAASFSYTVGDGTLTSGAAPVSVAVTAVNDAPVANADRLAATEDTPVTFAAVDLLANDTDIDTPAARLTIASVTSGAGGTAVLNADGTVTFTPGANFNGAADFSYTVSDGARSSAAAPASVAVSAVNDAPVANADSLAVTDGKPLTFSVADLLGNDTDIDTPHAALAIASVAGGTGGTAVLNPDGSVTFTPDPGFNGPADFTYTVTDGALTSTTVATVTAVPPAANSDAPSPIPVPPAEPAPAPAPVTGAPAQPEQPQPAPEPATSSDAPVKPEPEPQVVVAAVAPTPAVPVVQSAVDAGATRVETPGMPAAAVPGTTPAATTPAATAATAPGAAGAPAAALAGRAQDAGTRTGMGAAAAESFALAPDDVLVRVDAERALLSFARPVIELARLAPLQSVSIEGRLLHDEAAKDPGIVFARFDAAAQAAVASGEEVQRTLRSGEFSSQLDQLRSKLQQELDLDRTITVSVAGVSFGLSVLYVVWLIRGGVLMGSYLSALPAWRVLDPLPVLSRVGEEPEEEDEDDALDGGRQSRGEPLRGFG